MPSAKCQLRANDCQNLRFRLLGLAGVSASTPPQGMTSRWAWETVNAALFVPELAQAAGGNGYSGNGGYGGEDADPYAQPALRPPG